MYNSRKSRIKDAGNAADGAVGRAMYKAAGRVLGEAKERAEGKERESGWMGCMKSSA